MRPFKTKPYNLQAKSILMDLDEMLFVVSVLLDNGMGGNKNLTVNGLLVPLQVKMNCNFSLNVSIACLLLVCPKF